MDSHPITYPLQRLAVMARALAQGALLHRELRRLARTS